MLYILKEERMNHILLDLEWNQASHPARTVTVPLKLNAEIVQIGAVLVNEDFELLDTLKLTVRPKFYKKMHYKVKEITGLTAADLASGLPFPQALETLVLWSEGADRFLTWGPDDEGVLRDNCLVFGIDPDCLLPFCNLQLIFNEQISGENRQFSLSSALETLGETLLDAHDALNDALGTARLCRHLDMEKGLQDYPALYDAVTPPALFSLAAEQCYPSKRAALADASLSRIRHPIAAGELVCSPWVSASQWKSLAVGKDEKGREYLVTLKLIRKEDAKIKVSRTVHPLNGKLREQYREAKEGKKP